METAELRPGNDPAEQARAAAERGAPSLGVAGGDGSLGAVAGVALERDLPFVCVPFGTRNRFARDLGLDPEDSLGALTAFTEGVERRPLALSFEVDGRRDRRLALVALVASNDYGGGSLGGLGERERLDEGLLHAYVVEAVGRRALLALLAHAARGRPEEAEGLVEWTAASLRVELGRRRVHAAVDGEPVVLEPPLDFELRPRALRVLVPA